MSQQTDSHDTNVRIQSRIDIHGPIILLGGSLLLVIVLIGGFIFFSYCVTNWATFSHVQAPLLVNGALLLMGSLALCLSLFALVRLVAHPVLDLWLKWAEGRGTRARNKVVHTAEKYALVESRGEIRLLEPQAERHVYSHKLLAEPHTSGREQQEASNPLRLPTPRTVIYEEIAHQIPRGRALVGVQEGGRVATRDRAIRALLWIVGGSGTGKTNSVLLRVAEDYTAAHQFLVIDPHWFKHDSLERAIASYRSRFLMPIAHETHESLAVLDAFVTEFERRKNGGQWTAPVSLVVDEVGSLCSDAEEEDEKKLVRKLKEVARICGQEARGFDMCGIFISQDAAGLSWLRNRAIMVLAHQVTMWSERKLVCNNDARIARDMDTWPKGRTLVYGIGFDEGPQIYQQPLMRSHGPLMRPLTTHAEPVDDSHEEEDERLFFRSHESEKSDADATAVRVEDEPVESREGSHESLMRPEEDRETILEMARIQQETSGGQPVNKAQLIETLREIYGTRWNNNSRKVIRTVLEEAGIPQM